MKDITTANAITVIVVILLSPLILVALAALAILGPFIMLPLYLLGLIGGPRR